MRLPRQVRLLTAGRWRKVYHVDRHLQGINVRVGSRQLPLQLDQRRGRGLSGHRETN